MGDLIVSIDIGTSKICAVIGRMSKNSSPDIIGKGMVPCNGLKKGIIVDIESVAASIRAAVDEAEASANIKVGSAFVNIHGMHVNVINNKSWLSISNTNREITGKDVQSLLYSVRDIEIPDDRQLIDVIPRQFIIDGYDEIIDPTGMVGTRLEVDAYIIAGKITSVQNIIKSLERAGVRIDGIVAEAFGTGEIVLTAEEKDMGVIMLDIGGGVTDISVFQGKKLIFYDSIPVGGDHITNDIAIGLKISNAESEKIKRQYELALTSLIKNDQEISVFDINENKKKNVKISEVVEIIEARVYEIFSLCRNQAVKAGVFNNLAGGVVLTGGGISYVDGNKQLAAEVFELPVRVAALNHLSISKPEYIAAAGIIKYMAGIRKGSSSTSEGKLQNPRIVKKKSGIMNKFVKLIKGIF
ncbi:MAG: cell division protein FtsA [Ruminiclostridium sp.]|nr:cell division protein FtsA [Ruminiclostridium sp.]